MASERFVVLGLARPRVEWFREVSRWATSAALPVEFLKCVSVEELRSRLAGGRAYSAVLLDGGIVAVDRDLVQAVRDAGGVPIVIDDGRGGRDWIGLGAATVLPADLSREVLLDSLATHAQMVGLATTSVAEPGPLDLDIDLGHGRSTVAAVCGPGGTGTSTVAAALAEGISHDQQRRSNVLLVDMARHAEQAMLHDVRDVVPGIQELVDAHRGRRPSTDEILGLTFEMVERRYHLLLGLRRAAFWSTLRARSLEAAFESLRRTFDVVVCDTDADFEGEDDAGSADVEERNLLARTAALSADVVFVVGAPGVKGTHSLVRVLTDLAGHGVPAGRIVPVYNRAPRQARARAELVAALAELAVPAMGGGHTPTPVFLPGRRVEEAIRDGVRIPAPLPALLAGAFHATVERVGPVVADPMPPGVERRRVVPGSLGVSASDEAGH